MNDRKPSPAELELLRFAKLAKLTRSLQKRYFAGDRSETVLSECRSLEARLDAAAAWVDRNRKHDEPLAKMAKYVRLMRDAQNKSFGSDRSPDAIHNEYWLEMWVDKLAAEVVDERQLTLFGHDPIGGKKHGPVEA